MKVVRSIESLKKIYDKLLTNVAKKYNLTLMELKILLFLSRNECNLAKDIVEGLKATKSHVSMAVSNLEQNDFIEKSQDENDKKKNHLVLTEKAFEVIEKGLNVQEELKTIMIKDISKEELEMLSSICNKIEKNIINYDVS